MTGHAHRTTETRRRPGAGSAVRSVLASSGRLVRGRARTDVWLLLASCGLVGLSSLLAVAGPRSVITTIDLGAQDAVANAGAAAMVDVHAAVAEQARSTLGAPTVTVEGFLALAEEMPDRLPPALASVYRSTAVSLLTDRTPLLLRNGVPDSTLDADGEVSLQVGRLSAEAPAAMDVVDGRLPEPVPTGSSEVVEVVLSQAVADAVGLGVGDVVAVLAPLGDVLVADQAATTLSVVGIVAAHDPEAALWEFLPEAWAPVHQEAQSNRAAYTRTTLLTDDDGMVALAQVLGAAADGTVRLRLDPEAFTADLAAQVVTELEQLRVATNDLAADGTTPLTLRTGLVEVLEAYPPQARAAVAQMSVVTAGVTGVAAVVMILMSRLLVVRRGAVIALERARGASIIAVTVRLLAESVPVAVVGGVLGVAAGSWLMPGALGYPLPAVVVVIVAVLAAPVQGAWLARRAWTGRREPANRRDRALLAMRRAVRRVVVEGGAVVLAVAAAWSLRTRGLLPTTTQGGDPFLAAAPVLVALAVTLVVLRVYPFPIRVVGAVGRRARGPLGLLGAVRAERGVAVLPLLALTLGAALTITGGLLVDTVRTGQVGASWERVGADLRIDGELTGDQVADLAAQPGVTAVGSVNASSRVTMDYGAGNEQVTVVAVDRGYVELVSALATSDQDLTALLALADAPATGDVVPLVAQPSIVTTEDMALYYDGEYLAARGSGTTDFDPSGYLRPPFVFADLETLSAQMPEPLARDVTLVQGPGAAAAAEAVGIPSELVTLRTDWLADQRGLALHDGVERTMVLSVAAGGLLCVVALVATVLAGARERGRALSLLRTLGMRPRLGWWLALAELAPMVTAAVLAGTAAGILTTVTLAPALGLDILSGGLHIPDPSISPTVIVGLGAAAAVLLVLAAGVEVLAHHRDRLNDVLRVGET
jgi:putative ABC transport system permease protein